ncbi:hypothetical protein P3X46_008994 [Hevea brasiliensis]|uniref:Myb/SANT-like domain-containing protein n=1 Tax=Hevea brasiliensis TaxID=3981 RepID=A0ABQ9MKJ8_HEVBR|nr:hypothetical protein P3X46_008994 [Hevea brasiliensis]
MATKNKGAGRVAWSSEQFNLFVKICVRGTNLGKRNGGGWGDKGYTWLQNELRQVGVEYTKEQLRHKWDWMKDQWKMWKALKGNETGLGWDPIKGTVVAPDEWWNEKIKENSNFARFREKGIGQELYENYQELFLGTVATGEFAYAPSSGVLPNETQETQQFDTADHVEENINAESNFDDDLNEMMNAGFGSGGSFSQAVGENVGLENTKNDNSQHNVQKQKRKELSNDLATKKKKDNRGKKVSGATQMTDTVKELKETIKETMESKTATMCSLLGDRPGYSIEEVMKNVLTLPLIEKGSDIHFFCTLLLDQKSKREMYNTLEDAETKWKWLQFHFSLWTNGVWKPST